MLNSQYSSLWVEWVCGVNLVKNCTCIHQDLPDVVVIPSTHTHTQVDEVSKCLIYFNSVTYRI